MTAAKTPALSVKPGCYEGTTKELIADILLFIETLCGQRFYTFQALIARRLIESLILRDGAVISAIVSRQAGKTHVVGRCAVGLVVILPVLALQFPNDPRLVRFKNGFKVAMYGPGETKAMHPFQRARDVLSTQVAVDILNELKIGKPAVNKNGAISLSNGGSIVARTVSTATNVEGDSAHLIVLEETQDIEAYKYDKEIKPVGTNTRATTMAIGTANDVNGLFRELIETNEKRDALRTEGQPANHYLFNWKMVVADRKAMYEKEKRLGETPNEEHLSYAASVQDLIDAGKEETPEFQMNYMLRWRDLASGAIDRQRWALGATQLEFTQSRYRGVQVAGLDVGKTRDKSCLTIMDVDWDNPIIDTFYRGTDPEEARLWRKHISDVAFFKGSFESFNGKQGQYEQIFRFLSTKAVGLIVVDCTAIGDPVYERIKKVAGDSMWVEPFRFLHQEKLKLYKAYIQEAESGRLSYSAGPVTQHMEWFKAFNTQHLELRRKVNEDTQHISIEAPSGQHDDAPDSAALCNLGVSLVSSRTMPYIEQNPIPSSLMSRRALEGTKMGRRTNSPDSPIYRGK